MSELYVSAVLGRPVIDPSGDEAGRLSDLRLSPGEALPVVSGLFIRRAKKDVYVPWSEVSLFTPVVVSVRRPADEVGEPAEPAAGDILLKRDVLDRQIVDVDGAKVVRVNDLKLSAKNGTICVDAVDVGLTGLARRLGYLKLWRKVAALFGHEVPKSEIGWQYVQPLDKHVDRLTLTVTRERLTDLHPADIADILAQVPHQQVETVIASLDPEAVSEAIGELDPELGGRVLSHLDSEAASDILEDMDPHEAADVLGEVPEEKAQELLGLMDAEEAEKVQELLTHEEDTAGGLMNNEFAILLPTMTAEEALSYARLVGATIDNIYYLYVLDHNERPLGVVTLKRLLISPPKIPVTEIMAENLKTVFVDDSPEDVMEVIYKYNLLAVPVLDAAGKMAGIVGSSEVLELFLPDSVTRKRYAAH